MSFSERVQQGALGLYVSILALCFWLLGIATAGFGAICSIAIPVVMLSAAPIGTYQPGEIAE